MNKKIKQIETQFKQHNEQNHAAKIIQSLPGIGVLNASAFSASIDKGQAFKSACDFGVWLGLTPRQYASGSINRLSVSLNEVTGIYASS